MDQTMHGTTVLVQELTWPHYQKKLAEGAVVFLPIGSVEQHGPALPLGTDIYLPLGVCERVAAQIDGLVFPPISYGYKSQPLSGGGQTYPGTTSLHASTLIHLIRDILGEIMRHGARRICVYNGHFENIMCISEAIDLALRAHSGPAPHIVILRSPPLISTKTIEAIFGEPVPGWGGDHAGLFETAVMMALRPDLVHDELLPSDEICNRPPYLTVPIRPGIVPESGVLSLPDGATPEIGARMLLDMVGGALLAVRTEFGLDIGQETDKCLS